MSFERFDTAGASWDAAPNAAPPVGDLRDPRIHDVLCAIEQMEQRPRPGVLSDQQWFTLLKDARHVAEKWLDVAFLCDWSLLHLFGHPPHPRGRVGLMGVAALLGGKSIESIDRERIVIGNRLGPPNVFRRCSPGASHQFEMAGSELIWDVINREEWQ